MPSERFLKLKQVKKRTFLKMAYKEFALHSYEGASITRLVSDLKMAKGSVYQYFDNKEDMYLYLVEHAYSQLNTLLTKACPPANSSKEFDAWYKNYLLVYTKFFCAIPSYAFLIIRNKIELVGKGSSNKKLITQMIVDSSNNTLSKETIYFLDTLPITVFNYIVALEKVDIKELVETGNSLDISSDKLLYLCEAFFNNN